MDIVEDLNAGQPAPEEAQPVVVDTPAPESQAAEPVAREPTTETPEQTAQRERDDKGRFKAKTDETMVPLTALHETRDQVRELKAELEKLRPAPQAPQPQAVPDVFEDPQGFTGHIQSTVQQAVLNATLNLSEEMTRNSAGAEVVDQAQQWGTAAFAQNPALYQQFISQRNPYGFLVAEYKKATALAEISADPSMIEEFRAWKQGQATPAVQTTPTPPVPTSLANEQSSRGAATYQPPSLEEILGRKT